MKKILSIIAASLVITQSVAIAADYISPNTRQAIKEYKNGNYTGCQQLLWDEVVPKMSNDIYANYYFGLALWKGGNPQWASSYFDRVLSQNPKGDLKYYALNAKACTKDYEKCKAGKVQFTYPPLPVQKPIPVKKVVTKKVMPEQIKQSVPQNELDVFIGNNHSKYYKTVGNEVEQKRLEVLRYEINTGRPVDEYKFQRYKDYSNIKNQKSQANQPILAKDKLTAENINNLIESKSIEIQNDYDKLPYVMAQQKTNVKNR